MDVAEFWFFNFFSFFFYNLDIIFLKPLKVGEVSLTSTTYCINNLVYAFITTYLFIYNGVIKYDIIHYTENNM